MDEISMNEADFSRITAALANHTVRITINVLPDAVTSLDRTLHALNASDRQARHELGVRGVWVHDAKDSNSSNSIEQLGADPDQVKRLLALGALWVGPRHVAPT